MKLIIAEKPSVAGEIAKTVGATKREKGYYSGSGYLVSWCVGHLVQLAEPEAYDANFKKWSLSSLPIIPEQYKTEISERTVAQYNILKNLMGRNDVTELVCATDAAREGELIFRLVMDQAGCKKPFKRLWISSMEEKSIIEGLANMKDGREYDNLYKAALCRQRADWLIGINLTRLYSKMYNKTLKVGRVQTPTINLIVRRQREIESFIPRIYYTIVADLGSFKGYGKTNDKSVAQKIVSQCTGKDAFVTKVERQEKKDNPFSLYDLTTLQRDANRLFGYSAQETLDYIQQLYDEKLATYPRTDSRHITSDMEQSTRNLIDVLFANGIYGNIMKENYDTGKISMSRVVNNKKVTDHHAILPTGSVTKEKLENLPTGNRNILFLVSFRLLGAVYSPHAYATTTVLLDVDGEAFKATGKEIIDNGYKIVEEYIKTLIKANAEKEETPDNPDNCVLPSLREGDVFPVLKVSSEEKHTKPPKSYTEDTLLLAMETAGKDIADEELRDAIKGRGLGTPATRADVIENIIKTGYILRDKKQLIPSEMSYTFTDLVTEKIKEPDMTAEWEKQLSDIHQGRMSDIAFMDSVTGFIRSFVTTSINLYSPDQSGSIFGSDKESIGVCPKCGKKVIEYQKSYSCESGKGGCGFVIWRQIAGKTISQTQAQTLIEKGKTGLVKGFTSKSGNLFDAYLIFKDDKSVGFDFPKKT